MGTDLDPRFVASYRFFRGYGADAQQAMGLATNERMLQALIAAGTHRVQWESDDEPADLSWATEDEQAKYRKELESGELESLAVMLQKGEDGEWVTIDSCFGIFIYVKDVDNDTRYHAAAVLDPFA